MILEKAYAKMYGRYEKIEAGWPGDSLRDLTGAPCDQIEPEGPEDADKIFEQIF